MNVNTISVLLGCAGLAIGGIGLLAQQVDRSPADAAQSARAAWPAQAAGVAFNDEMIELLTLGAKPRAQPARAVPAEGETAIRSIRMTRVGGSRGARVAEIEFVDRDGRAYRRHYPVGQDTFAAGNARDVEAGRTASEANGDTPRRSRRSARSYHRGWWW